MAVEFDVINVYKKPYISLFTYPKNGKVVTTPIKYYYNLTEQEKFVDALRLTPGSSNLSVSNVRNLPNKHGEVDVVSANDPFPNDDRYAIDDLHILFQILNLHDYKYEKTTRPTRYESRFCQQYIQSVFTKPGIPIRVKINFPMDVDPTNSFSEPISTIRTDAVLNGKIVEDKIDYYYDLSKAQQFVEDLIDAPAAKGGGGKKKRNNKGKNKKQSRKTKGKGKSKGNPRKTRKNKR